MSSRSSTVRWTVSPADFHYTLANDGTISIKLDTDPTNHVWTMKYQNGKIIAPIKPSVVNSQAEARSVTRGEEATDVVELTSATDEELTRIQSMDATVPTCSISQALLISG